MPASVEHKALIQKGHALCSLPCLTKTPKPSQLYLLSKGKADWFQVSPRHALLAKPQVQWTLSCFLNTLSSLCFILMKRVYHFYYNFKILLNLTALPVVPWRTVAFYNLETPVFTRCTSPLDQGVSGWLDFARRQHHLSWPVLRQSEEYNQMMG